jgi:hypothetical protein
MTHICRQATGPEIKMVDVIGTLAALITLAAVVALVVLYVKARK